MEGRRGGGAGEGSTRHARRAFGRVRQMTPIQKRERKKETTIETERQTRRKVDYSKSTSEEGARVTLGPT